MDSIGATIVDPQYDYLSVFMASFVATAPEAAAYEWVSGHVHLTFHTMAEAASSRLNHRTQ